MKHVSTELWAMDPSRLSAFLAELSALPSEAEFRAAFPGEQPKAKPALYALEGGKARLKLHGPMMRHAPWIARALGLSVVGTVEARQALADAIADDEVESIVLDIDSPGGTVSGTEELADAVAAAARVKHVSVESEGALCSAAYWVASQADEIHASKSTMVGSIGVVAAIRDDSAAAAQAGVKIHVIASSALKGAGYPGAPISDEQLADVRRLIDTQASRFFAAVGAARSLSGSGLDAVTTGQVWLADEAQRLGLIDGVLGVEHQDAAGTVPGDDSAPAVARGEMSMKNKSEATAPQGVDELAKLKADSEALAAKAAEVDALQAKLDELEAQAKTAEAAARQAVIDKYADRITPAASEALREMCAGLPVAKVEAFLSALPPAVRSSRQSAASVEAGQQATADITPEMKAVAKLLGNSAEDLVKHGNIKN